MKTHELKISPVYFDAVARGDKTFEVCKNDQDFQAQDMLVLREWDSALVTYNPPWPAGSRPADAPKDHDGYTGRELFAVVSYVFHDTWEKFGLLRGYVILGLDHIENAAAVKFDEFERNHKPT